jgi:hypothetical protein
MPPATTLEGTAVQCRHAPRWRRGSDRGTALLRGPALGHPCAARTNALPRGLRHITEDILDANAARCRVFLLDGEDVNIVQIIGILRRWVPIERRAELEGLRALARARIKDGKLVGAHLYTAARDPSQGIEAGPLLGNDQTANDYYIYGHLVHQDRDAEARRRRVGRDNSLKFPVVSKLNDLMQVVYFSRFEIRRALEDGSLSLVAP